MAKNFKEIPNVIKASFRTWGAKNLRYNKYFKRLNKDVLSIADDCFDEVTLYMPGSFEIWWATNHNRYIRKHAQRDLTLLQELVYKFLCDLISGRLGKEKEEESVEKEKVNDNKEKFKRNVSKHAQNKTATQAVA